MYEDVMELAENKLLLLYIMNKINVPISNSHITQIVLENNLINYFSLQQFLSELIDNGFIKDAKKDRQHILNVTLAGKNALEFFKNRIPPKKKELVDNYLNKHIEIIKNDVEVSSEYEGYGDNKFMVNLKLSNEDEILMQLKIVADSNEEARNICSLWKQNPKALYEKIRNILK